MPERVSIRQVAKMAQVSPMTVTRVLRGQDTVADDTRQRVLEAVRLTDYVPVRSAVQNRHVTNHVLGYVPNNVDLTLNRIDSETYAGISYAAYQQDYDILVMLRKEANWMAERAELRFLDRRSDGFLFVSTVQGEWEPVLKALVQYEVPTVVCYRRDVPEGVCWIDPDNEAIVQLAVEALVRRGHRRIAYITAPVPYPHEIGKLAYAPSTARNYDDAARRDIFARLIGQEYRIDFAEIMVANHHPVWDVDRSVLEAIREQRITGVVCINDLIALRLWKMMEESGLRVPEDLSIIGVDDSKEAEQIGLTSVGFRYNTVGAVGVTAWHRLVTGEAPEDCNTIIPVALQERRSIISLA